MWKFPHHFLESSKYIIANIMTCKYIINNLSLTLCFQLLAWWQGFRHPCYASFPTFFTIATILLHLTRLHWLLYHIIYLIRQPRPWAATIYFWPLRVVCWLFNMHLIEYCTPKRLDTQEVEALLQLIVHCWTNVQEKKKMWGTVQVA